MARDVPSRASRSGLSWFVDHAVEKWPYILAGVSGSVMAFLTAATKWLSVYGPIAWGAAFLVGFLIFGAGWWILAIAQKIAARTRFATKREDTAAINPLDDHFARRRINLFDFFHPFYEPIRAAKFQDCELYGPSAIYLMGGTFLTCLFDGCEAVIVKSQIHVVGATAFENCTFERCKFFRVTFLMPKDQYLGMMRQAGGTAMPVISDGTVGNL